MQLASYFAAFVAGGWFGMTIMALARMAADDVAPGDAIHLHDRHGHRVILRPNGRHQKLPPNRKVHR